MKTLSSRMKISTVEQIRTPRQRRKSHSDHKRKQNQENPVNDSTEKHHFPRLKNTPIKILPTKHSPQPSSDVLPFFEGVLRARCTRHLKISPHRTFRQIDFTLLSRLIPSHLLKLFSALHPPIQMLSIFQLQYQLQHQCTIQRP